MHSSVENSPSDLRYASSDTPGRCFWRMSQNKKSFLPKMQVISLILPGQKWDWMMATGSEVLCIFPHWRHLNLLWFTSKRPEILKYILCNYVVCWEGQTGYCTLYHRYTELRDISVHSMLLIFTRISHEYTCQSIPWRMTTIQRVLGRILSGSQFPPHIVQQRKRRKWKQSLFITILNIHNFTHTYIHLHI